MDIFAGGNYGLAFMDNSMAKVNLVLLQMSEIR